MWLYYFCSHVMGSPLWMSRSTGLMVLWSFMTSAIVPPSSRPKPSFTWSVSFTWEPLKGTCCSQHPQAAGHGLFLYILYIRVLFYVGVHNSLVFLRIEDCWIEYVGDADELVDDSGTSNFNGKTAIFSLVLAIEKCSFCR